MAKKIEDKELLDIKEKLDKQPKVRIKIPVDPLNPKDKVVPVGINGYFYYINRGETVEVPDTIADILENAKYI